MSWVKGQKHSDEAKRKIGAASRGRRHSEESRRKIGMATLGRKDSNETKHRKSESAKRRGNEPPHPIGERSSRWKGAAVGYAALHSWVRRWKELPKYCKECGSTTKRLNWANKDHTYRRNLEDYIALCGSCHIKYDYANNERVGRRDYTISEETRRKISERTKQAMANPEVRQRISEAKKGKPPWNKGIRLT